MMQHQRRPTIKSPVGGLFLSVLGDVYEDTKLWFPRRSPAQFDPSKTSMGRKAGVFDRI